MQPEAKPSVRLEVKFPVTGLGREAVIQKEGSSYFKKSSSAESESQE